MRVLILANNDIGLYKFRKELIEAFISHKNEVFISLPDGALVRPLEKAGCVFLNTPVDRRGMNIKADLILLVQYYKMINAIQPDIVITYTIKPNIYGGIAARLAGKQYAVNITGLGTAFEKPGIVRTLVITLYKLALKKAKVIFFENSSNRDDMVSLGCCKQERTTVLNGAGVNTEFFSYQPYPQHEVFKFLFIGRVMKEKGVDELFAAMKRLVDEGQECILDVVGPFEEDYEKKLEGYERQGWLKYHGYQEDVRPFIKDCNCFVLPSYHEGMANTVLECASMGRPIIASNIPGCKEAIVDGTSGLLCGPKSIEELYESMRTMLSFPPKERSAMGVAGRKHMEKSFDRKTIITETLQQLQERMQQ